MSRPRPSKAPEYERSRSPPRSRAPPPPRSRAPPLPSRREQELKEEEPEEQVRADLSLPRWQLERVLGPEGSTLIDVCRSCCASIALRPVLRDAGDSFVLEVSGSAPAVEAAEDWLAALLAEGEDVPAREDVLGESPLQVKEIELPRSMNDYALSMRRTGGKGMGMVDGLQVKEIELPRYMNDYVLSMRQPGGKGMGKADGLFELQEISGVAELTCEKVGDKEITHLRAVGVPAALSQLTELLNERLAAFQDVIRDTVEVPKYAVGMLFRDDFKVAFEIEAASGAKLSVGGKKPVHICLRGTADQIDHAKELVLERCHGRGCKGKGKGKHHRTRQRQLD